MCVIFAGFLSLPPVVEDRPTIHENALKKATEVARQVRQWVLADDTALEVEELGGAPGVHSARYSGPGATYESNRKKLLAELKGIPEDRRTASFGRLSLCGPRIACISSKESCTAGLRCPREGIMASDMTRLFELPDGRTLAEIELDEKNRISHRAQALQRARDFLEWLLAGQSCR